ncbi:Uncharacterized protein OBRU01_12816 [Operophtera brumata]|uniref:Derlin n=1 Tax=Operophtera brumata TaxID=104452 RepID=A0A0L7L279_OPEBR|nr:Uncharacterized protein OBRU01_12816 [Operophtera brumata]
MSEFKDWWNGVPFFTRYWLSLTIGLSLLGRFGLLNMYYLMLDFPSIFYSFQILMDPMVLSVLYVWCQLNKDMIVSFWFGTRFKAMKQIFPDTRYVGGFGSGPRDVRPAAAPARETFGHNWGRGHALGGN